MERAVAEQPFFPSELKPGEYYFQYGKPAEEQNFPWVLRAAKAKSDAVFAHCGQASAGREASAPCGFAQYCAIWALAGSGSGTAKEALMAHCRAFRSQPLTRARHPAAEKAATRGTAILVNGALPWKGEIHGSSAAYIGFEHKPRQCPMPVTPANSPAAPSGPLQLGQKRRRNLNEDSVARNRLRRLRVFRWPHQSPSVTASPEGGAKRRMRGNPDRREMLLAGNRPYPQKAPTRPAVPKKRWARIVKANQSFTASRLSVQAAVLQRFRKCGPHLSSRRHPDRPPSRPRAGCGHRRGHCSPDAQTRRADFIGGGVIRQKAPQGEGKACARRQGFAGSC